MIEGTKMRRLCRFVLGESLVPILPKMLLLLVQYAVVLGQLEEEDGVWWKPGPGVNWEVRETTMKRRRKTRIMFCSLHIHASLLLLSSVPCGHMHVKYASTLLLGSTYNSKMLRYATQMFFGSTEALLYCSMQ